MNDEITTNLLGYMAIRSGRTDQALGMTFPAHQTRTLAYHYYLLRRGEQHIPMHLTVYFRLAILSSTIEQCANKVKILVKEAETTTDEQRIRQIYYEVLGWQKMASQAETEFDKLKALWPS